MNNLQIPYNQYFKKECRLAAEAGFRFISLNLHETEEDTLCARYIKALLEGERLDMDKEIDALRLTSGAKFFDPKQNDTFPRADFDLCTRLDCFDFAKVTRIIRTCLKAVNCGAFRPFSFGGRQPTCSKEEQKSPPISSSLRSKILKSADFCQIKA